MRRLRPGPVPDDLIRRILEAGISASNGGNAQRWQFLVVKDPEIKKAVRHIHRVWQSPPQSLTQNELCCFNILRAGVR